MLYKIKVMKPNLKKYKVYFFDFDGVIADTELLHFDAFNKVLKKFNIKITKKEYFDEYLAYDDKGCFKKVFIKKLNKKLTTKKLQKLVDDKTKILMRQIKFFGVKYYEDAIKFINYLYSNFESYLCIVSGALKQEIYFVLKKLKLYDKFSLIISAEDVKNGKPSPEPFIIAKKQLEKKTGKKFLKNEILVIEDSINGVKSAIKAGFDVVAVAHTYPVEKFKKIGKMFVIKKLTELIN